MTARAAVLHPTKERRNHGSIVKGERIIEGGLRVTASYVEFPSALAMLETSIDFGADKARCMNAADWFRVNAEVAALRAWVTMRLDGAHGGRSYTPRQARARRMLRAAGEAIGGTAFNRLIDLLVWDVPAMGEVKQRETREALLALAAYLRLT